MDIILKQDIPNLGYKNDIVKVKNGYARNYLIPKGFAIAATPANKKMLEETLKQRAFKEEKLVKEAEVIAKGLEAVELKIGAKVGTSGKIFGSVNALQIAEALNEKHNFDIDRKKIFVDGSTIKEVGKYTAKIILHKEVQVELSFEVIGE